MRVIEAPPVVTVMDELLAATAWSPCAATLDGFIEWFHFWYDPEVEEAGPLAMDTGVDGDDALTMRGAAALAAAPQLPRTGLQFGGALCEAVAQARGAPDLAPTLRAAAVKWLLLPFSARRCLNAPFQGSGGGDHADTCWACAVQVRRRCATARSDLVARCFFAAGGPVQADCQRRQLR
jgi:hypothetical protein